ncbi:MAG: FAD-dependent monooxygenase [Deltaproteobacteria bacterium]|jgi:digeranylgeranylglycerophospholipid reductase|nr:FAD-dependent monooxygenase [Deltaproteobacteria bacterium]
MAKKYDVVIVGAGPGGAMAAKTAGENGLKVAILERKTNPALINRGCAMMFAIESGYYFAERMYYNDKNKKMIFPVNGFTVDYDGPTRNYYAWHFYAPDGKTRLEFGDYEECIKKGDQGRLSFVYDKGILIDGLMKEVEKSGVDVFTGVNVNGIEKTAQGIKVTGNGETFEGTFVIAADGLESRIAKILGFYKERTCYGSIPGITYYVTGLKLPQSEAIITTNCFKPGAQLPTFFWLIPSPYADDEFWFSVFSQDDFEYITKESIFSKWFSDVKVTRVRSHVSGLWSPVAEPYRDNVLLVGDSAWFGEAEITGAMMCGWKAAHAITVALRDNKPHREGVLNYIEWWKKSYPEFDDYRNFFMFVPFCSIFSEEESNYLYGLFKSPLPANNNPFLVVRQIKQALEPLMDQINKEMPSVGEKLTMLEIDNIDTITRQYKDHVDAFLEQK